MGSAEYWDAVARQNAAWYIATSYTSESPEFFAQGAAETDALLHLCGVPVRPEDVLLEIGCGVGRMTHRLAERAGSVIAVDVSAEMLARAGRHLADQPNVTLLKVPGDGTLPSPDASVDVVFSYITLQHVPSAAAQLCYLAEAIRLLRPGGRAAIQLRAPGAVARAHDWAGHLGHFSIRGRRTLARAWRGARVPAADLLGLAGTGVRIDLLASGHRHVWFVARRDAVDEKFARGSKSSSEHLPP